MSETEYACQKNCHFDDCLYADDGFIAELPVSYRMENLENSYYHTKITEFYIFHKRGKSWNWPIFNAEFASVKCGFMVALHNVKPLTSC